MKKTLGLISIAAMLFGAINVVEAKTVDNQKEKKRYHRKFIFLCLIPQRNLLPISKQLHYRVVNPTFDFVGLLKASFLKRLARLKR